MYSGRSWNNETDRMDFWKDQHEMNCVGLRELAVQMFLLDPVVSARPLP